MSTTTQSTKTCDRCGVEIGWNNSSKFFQSLEFPGYKHCCKKTCNKQGCGGIIYFSNLCPKNPQTGNAIPLAYPVPVQDPNNPSQKVWMPHVHNNSIPATDVPTNDTTQPTFPNQQPQGQTTLVAGNIPTTAPQPQVQNIPIANEQSQNIPVQPQGQQPLIAETANQDINSAILTAINANTQALKEFVERMDKIEKFLNDDVLPEYRDFSNYWTLAKPKLDVLIGKITEGSIKTASDLIEYHQQDERAEQNLQ